MAQNPPADMPRITPYLFYENVGAAVDWLAATFGLQEVREERHTKPDGSVWHAAMNLGDGLVMMGTPEAYANPKRTGSVHATLYVYVDDVDAHHARAAAAGAVVISGLEDTFYGDRRYMAEDLEGHWWTFAQRTRDLAPEDRHPSAEDLAQHG